jgi:hypothetical protein
MTKNRLYRISSKISLNTNTNSNNPREGGNLNLITRVATLPYLKCPVFNKKKDFKDVVCGKKAINRNCL